MDDTTAMRPNVFPITETQYTLNAVSNVVGSNAKNDAVTLHVYKDFLIPTAFSPNADGLNDMYPILELDSYKLVTFSIFNRWEVKIFSTLQCKYRLGWKNKR